MLPAVVSIRAAARRATLVAADDKQRALVLAAVVVVEADRQVAACLPTWWIAPRATFFETHSHAAIQADGRAQKGQR